MVLANFDFIHEISSLLGQLYSQSFDFILEISTWLSKWKLEAEKKKNLSSFFFSLALILFCRLMTANSFLLTPGDTGQMLLPRGTTWCSPEFNYTFAKKKKGAKVTSSNTKPAALLFLKHAKRLLLNILQFQPFLVFFFNRYFFRAASCFCHFLFQSRLKWLPTVASDVSPEHLMQQLLQSFFSFIHLEAALRHAAKHLRYWASARTHVGDISELRKD